MTRKETTEILAVIQTAYSRFYQGTPSSELSKVADLWSEMFKDDQAEVVVLAVKSLIQTLEFPPTIADVRREINKLIETATDKPSAMDEWNAIRGAIRNSIYNSVQCFESLPPIAKRFVGSPNQLRSWAMSEDFNDGVVRGQFLKQYEVLDSRERYKALMSPNTRDLIQRLASEKSVKLLEEAEDV